MKTRNSWMWAAGAFAAGALALTGCRDDASVTETGSMDLEVGQEEQLGTGGAGVRPSQTEQDPRYHSIRDGTAEGLAGSGGPGKQQGQSGTGGAGMQHGHGGATDGSGMMQQQQGQTGGATEDTGMQQQQGQTEDQGGSGGY